VDLDLVVQAAPSNAEALFARSVVRSRTGDTAGAAADLAAAQRLEPGIAAKMAAVGLRR
jgi:hypothetical protein